MVTNWWPDLSNWDFGIESSKDQPYWRSDARSFCPSCCSGVKVREMWCQLMCCPRRLTVAPACEKATRRLLAAHFEPWMRTTPELASVSSTPCVQEGFNPRCLK
ncbi:hypothetical protein TNCV_4930311 [Trichonephila clavipes]|nr:hypothetical protein TNCV_4930311 [Trichonephila clavipes]